MPAMPGSRGVGRQGLHIKNDRGGTEFQGESAVEGAMSGVQEGLRKGVTGGAPPNPAQCLKRGVGERGQR